MADEYEIKDSGHRRILDSGAQRDRARGKGRFDLVPPFALEELAKHFEQGALKYASRNWELGMPLSYFLDSAMRHANKYLMGMRDENHIIAMVWNGMCLVQTRELIKRGILPKELDDLPDYTSLESFTKTVIEPTLIEQKK